MDHTTNGTNPDDNDWQNNFEALAKCSGYALDNQLYTDVCFLVGPNKDRVPAHRLILTLRSPVFKSMFFGDLAAGDKEISLPDVELEGFKKMLR